MSSEERRLGEMNLDQVRVLAEQRVNPEVWEWVNGGTETESTLQRNRLALERIMLRLKVIHGLETVNTRANIFGQTVNTPIIVAPFARMNRVHPEAEMAIARGAEKAGAMMFLGPVSGYSIDEIVEATGIPVAWNGDPLKDRKKLLTLIRQAEKAGSCAVGLCADDFQGIKIRDRLRVLPTASLSKEAVREARQETSLPFFLKGIMTVEDALTAAEAGVDAIVVSNHGGRVLDGCQASIEVLSEIVKAVGSSVEILIDGGFRRGTDVLKALALGAKGVLVGRPVCWGLGAGGAEGVAHVLQMLTGELIRTMILTNVPDVKHVPRDTVVTP